MRFLYRDRALFTAAIIMTICFVAGVVAGTITACYSDVTMPVTESVVGASFGAVFLNIFTYPALALLLGLSLFGVAALPLLMAIRGFLLAFAITTIAKNLGIMGIIYALGLFGVQCLIVLPCLLYISARGFLTSGAIVSLATRTGKKVAVFSREYLIGTSVAMVFLIAATAAESIITPALATFIKSFIR